jgi:hypothetical protein
MFGIVIVTKVRLGVRLLGFNSKNPTLAGHHVAVAISLDVPNSVLQSLDSQLNLSFEGSTQQIVPVFFAVKTLSFGELRIRESTQTNLIWTM